MPIRTDSTARPDDDIANPGMPSTPSRPAVPALVNVPQPVAAPGAVRVAGAGPVAGPGRVPGAGPVAAAGHPPRPTPNRPDPSMARMAVAAGGIATVSALLAAIGGSAVPSTTAASSAAAVPAPVQTVVRYVYLPAGQASPAAGLATVVTPPAPAQAPAPVVTRQSGAKP